jgi:hypothetical protein
MTPTPTIDDIFDALRRTAVNPVPLVRITPDKAEGALGDGYFISITYDLLPETDADGDHYGETIVTRCAVTGGKFAVIFASFLPRTADAAARWLERKAIDYRNTRSCDECNKDMTEGYVIDGGAEYYCSEVCLHKHYTPEEWAEMYDDGNTDSYWTEWEI